MPYETIKPNSKILDQLIRNRFKPPKELRALLDKHSDSIRRSKQRSVYLKGVHNGQFYRITIPPKQPLLPKIPKLPQTILGSPKPFITSSHQQQVAQEIRQERVRDVASQLLAWWNANWAVLILNFGSICSLVGFTRSDVLELRMLSVTGSVTSFIYHMALKPRPYTPITWSCIFAAVNGFKIYEVLQEREGVVKMTKEQESVYSNFFMSHGVTPKQFELIWNKAEIQTIPKGQTFIQEGQEMTHVTLVIRGETRAQSIFGRRLTAASFKKSDDNEDHDDTDGDRMSWTSGAWIGEIALLDKLWSKQKSKKESKKGPGGSTSPPTTTEQGGKKAYSTTEQGDKKAGGGTTATPTAKQRDKVGKGQATSTSEQQQPITTDKIPKKAQSPLEPKKMEEEVVTDREQRRLIQQRTLALTRSSAMSSSKAMYNIVALEDTVIMRWKHEDMEAMMEKSSDLRGALTRAMTAAIVGKVINFTVSTNQRAFNKQPNWASWLGDWGAANNNNAGVVRVQKLPAATAASPPLRSSRNESAESPPGGPIKKFG